MADKQKPSYALKALKAVASTLKGLNASSSAIMCVSASLNSQPISWLSEVETNCGGIFIRCKSP